jgi:hypothetical protein
LEREVARVAGLSGERPAPDSQRVGELRSRAGAGRQLTELSAEHRQYVRARDRFNEESRKLVYWARQNGASWSAVGRAVGMSAQGAQQKWGSS